MADMRGLVLAAAGRFEVRDVAEPEPGPNDALVAVTHSGICGSELGGFRGDDGLRHPGLIFGHEFVGRVVDYGSAVASGSRLPIGTMVTANPLRPCGRCRLCRWGHENVCTERELLGAHVHGSNAELVVVPASALLSLEAAPEPLAGVFTEPAACAWRAVRRTQVRPGGTALVIGAGPIGLLVIEVLRLHGVESVWFTETVAGRVSAAEASGGRLLSAEPAQLLESLLAETSGLGVDAVFDAVGTQQTRASATACARPGGDVMFVGLHEPDAVLPVRQLIRREINCQTSFAYSGRDFAETLALLCSGQLRFRGEVVQADLAEGQLWYERLLGGSAVGKVLLSPEPSLAQSRATTELVG
ncbi:threonine dehydrogenase-like Zn-dependent dehydrogenase [Microlunatus panaciterrae]|uniref:Threonine dehydrogenase-like Zn-dependent dehydrogenase n=1 Tax=Microlunatus panaciterrae TaxID=400768 RepID=A0ABS2RGL8_9ACTN|nr:alcohol dehydrogenase catalytic domain-containing protein [Microlunatus panaciterrae]MBM7797682.1 threonine dehydrogenase-like Zn-dependent dehydrogenase [Microlunatus panaciterrae]